MVGILAIWNKAWIGLAQGICFLTFDREEVGLRELGNAASILADGAGGLPALVMLGFLLRYRAAWACRRVPARP
ncbi:hypothetical protein [Nonomuraea sp. SYSU D8015]|uniref:hypothetical protein n=1 Tax=Nonomuraea sp. SYSU D8015 TaxID=2593644 RepID=UPI0016607CEF|nr:hypothetical protein [Nonomuraea sp. SYSU D8015]